MNQLTREYLIQGLNMEEAIVDLAIQAESEIQEQFKKIEEIAEFNQYKVLAAMQKNRLSDIHFNYSTGYGYGDIGRDNLDRVYADIFCCEDALVRPQMASGTHALTLCLFGVLRPGDEMVALTGKPYDTLDNIIGIQERTCGSLADHDVGYKQLDLTESGKIDYKNIESKITTKTKLVLIQRSTGYSWRESLSLMDIKKAIDIVKAINPNIVCMVDNCYGEFIDVQEPTQVGADLMAGSLIKNPGGSIAPTGGYVAGKSKYVHMAADRMIAPGLGKECGATLGMNRLFYQGLFLAPHITSQAVKGAVFCARLFELLGYESNPSYKAHRSDIIQAIKFNNPEDLIAFCQGIQKGSPVDSFVSPQPWDMPGYNDQVIMAAGGFVQGASIELSADAPIRPPYIAYLQGGVTFDHAKIGILYAVQNIRRIKK